MAGKKKKPQSRFESEIKAGRKDTSPDEMCPFGGFDGVVSSPKSIKLNGRMVKALFWFGSSMLCKHYNR